jgi:U4/U6.U5 tri-snRNP component SNU23
LFHPRAHADLRHLGQTTRQGRSTLNQVRAKIAALREETAAKAKAKQVDFDQRLRDIAAAEETARTQRKLAKKAKAEAKPTATAMDVDPDMASMMGFASFGGTKA